MTVTQAAGYDHYAVGTLIEGVEHVLYVCLPGARQAHDLDVGWIFLPQRPCGIGSHIPAVNAGEERDFRLTDDMDITMVWIPSGEFMMGAQDEEQDAEDDEYPRHRVTLDYGFWMGKYEVTQEQWEAVMGENPSHDYGVGDDYPVYYVSWDDIQDFEEELDNAFRLPSESEWEYACRAGHDETRFHWGDDDNYEQLGNYAWYEGNSGEETHPVGQKGANDWGLKDMSGNVWEWCEDWYHDSYDGAPNDGSPWVAGGGQYRVMRGGSWGNVSSICRSANRNNGNLDYRSNVSGFRLVRDAD